MGDKTFKIQGVSLERDRPLQLKGMPPNDPNMFYRAHGADGFRDWLNTNQIRGNQTGPYTENAYFSKGAPLDRYANPIRSGSDYVVSTTQQMPENINHGVSQYYKTPAVTNNDFYSIYKRGLDNNYEHVHTNVPTNMIRSGGVIPTALSKISPYTPQAIKTGASMLGNFMNRANLPMLGAQAIYNATADARARNETQQRIRDFASIPKNTEIRNLP